MIQLDGITKHYGQRVLFEGLSWKLEPGRRIGLIGPNGAGKSTLFAILSGRLEADGGRVVIPRGATIGLLPQEVGVLPAVTALDVVLAGRRDLVDLEAEMATLQTRIDGAARDGTSHDEIERLGRKLAAAQERYAAGDGWALRARASEIMAGMGFREEDRARNATEFSGGWRMRLVLSSLLLQRPDVLLLDEPTNHLDLPSVEWLERFLADYEGTVVVISHDRYFLNRLVNEIAAFEPDGFHVTPGNWDRWLEARAERLEALEKQKASNDRKIAELTRFVERFRAKASKATQAQSKAKQLARIERIEIQGDRKKIGFHFAEAEPSGKVAIAARGVGRRFGDLVLFRGLDLEIRRGEKVAVVGPNGAGKTTLLRMLAAVSPPDDGQIEWGHRVKTGWFAQHQVEMLNLDRTVLEEMEAAADFDSIPRCRSILGAFLFSGDDVMRRVGVLSGGERNRLALARMLLQPSNLLLLDEPTNHLDMESRDVLEEALSDYGGTVVFVSHDRQFINGIASRVLHVEAGRVIDYPGDYEYYHWKREQEAALPDARRQPGGVGSAGPDGFGARSNDATDDDGNDRRARKRREAEFRQALSARTAAARRELTEVERSSEQADRTIAELEARLASPDLYERAQGTEISRLQTELAAARARSATLLDRWAELSEGLEREETALREQFGMRGS